MKRNLLIGGAILLGIIGAAWALNERGANQNAENVTTPPSLTAVTTLGEPSETATPTSTVSEVTPAETTYPVAPSGAKPAVPAPTLGSPLPNGPVVPAMPSKAPYVATIYYDGSNFIPETVTIPQGATVLFENASDRLLWVAANPHPSHTRYAVKTSDDCAGSAFDQCKAMKEGETWSFTFSEVGDWKYHNHIRDVDEGEVMVLSKEKYLKYEKEQSQSR